MTEAIPKWWLVEVRFLRYLLFYPKTERLVDQKILQLYKEKHLPMDVNVLKADLKRRFVEARYHLYSGLLFMLLYPFVPHLQVHEGIVTLLLLVVCALSVLVYRKNMPGLMVWVVYVLTLTNSLLDGPNRLPNILLMGPLLVLAWGRFRLLPPRGHPGRLPRHIEGWVTLAALTEILVVHFLQQT